MSALFTNAEAPLPPATLDEQIQCIERELGFRRKCYPKWVGEKRMTQKLADREIRFMEAVLETLKSVNEWKTKYERKAP